MGQLLALTAILACPVQAPTAATTDLQRAAVVRKVAALLEEAQLKSRKMADGLWSITFRGDRLESLEVVIAVQADMVIVSSTIQTKPELDLAQYRQLLEANYKANYSKLAIDDDGDLLAMTELPTDVSAQALRNAIDEVASLTDTAVGLVASSGSSKPAPSEHIDPVPPGRGASLSLARGAFELSYDPAKWKQEATTEAGVTQLNHVSGELWARVIAERLEINSDGLRELALTNAKSVAPDTTLSTETWRTVNGLRVLVLRYGGSRAGFKFTFYNQLYSDAAGMVQIAGWTGSNLFEESRHDLLELFAGFNKTKK